MNFKKLIPLLRGLFGPDGDPVLEILESAQSRTRSHAVSAPIRASIQAAVAEQSSDQSRRRQIATSKKVKYNSRCGRKLTARVMAMNGNGTVLLRRAKHPLASTFLRPTTQVFFR